MHQANRRADLLIAKQIGYLYEKLPAVVQVAALRVQQVSILVQSQRPIQILQIAVVAYINRSSRMGKVSQQHIRVYVLDVLQRG
jgi:hypothetical protein